MLSLMALCSSSSMALAWVGADDRGRFVSGALMHLRETKKAFGCCCCNVQVVAYVAYVAYVTWIAEA
jgi:hypothetical protein